MRSRWSTHDLHNLAWEEARLFFSATKPKIALPERIPFSYGDYPHFRTKRGFGVTFCYEDPKRCEIMVAKKIDDLPHRNREAILLHELGHVIDHLVPKKKLDAIAEEEGVLLARLPEQRADDIVELVWGRLVRYDDADIQTLSENGRYPRPAHLPR
jgi:hypothetical protein